MTQHKHTPGPWTWDEDFDALHPLWEMGMAQGYGYIDWNDRTKMESNARLIAAAPGLLSALEMALVWLDYEGKYDVQGIRAVIAKAQGKE